MTRLLRLLAVLMALALFAAACGDSDDDADDAAATETTAAPAGDEGEADEPAPTTEAEADGDDGGEEEAEEPASEAIVLEFWHAMGDELGESVDELVDRFNDSQDAIQVNATFQGSYDDTYNALLASFDSASSPNVVQNFDLASQTMFDTGRLVPAHELMAADGYDPATFLPAVRDYYSDADGMVAMAFNSSTPILYYNAEILEAAGVEPPEESWTFSELIAACDAIQAAGTEFCITFGQVGWFYEQILANSGGLYFDNDNGRTGRATEVVFNEGQGVEVFDFLAGLFIDGYAPNLGNTWTETDSVFFAGQAAMIFDSTAGAAGFDEGSEFEVGTMFIPHSDSSERNGVVIGGAALWLMDSGDDGVNQAAWEFMRFMAEQDQQITWHTSTGYFPVRVDSQDDATLQSFWDENPNFRTAIDQLATTRTEIDGEVNYPVLGGRAGPFPAIRRIIVESYSRVIDDGVSAQEALDEAKERADQELTDYNEFFG
ncbi:MAG: ABC transporter substrate-binding protein [Actinomycetota bacterium]